MSKNILVIKLGAFGDFIQALGPMAAIRRHHPEDHITLLTSAPFVTLARESGYFNAITVDPRPKWSQPAKILKQAQLLRKGNFARVYDLQNSDRTALYLKLFGFKKPEWVGAAPGASHRNNSPQRTAGHAFDGHIQTLMLAGIENIEVDDLSWVRGDANHFGLPHPHVLIVPGCAPDRQEKRWPAELFGRLARQISDWGFTPVIIGTSVEEPLAKTITHECPAAINLCSQTSMMDLVLLGRVAAGAIGNDTGPMHVIGPTGCPSIVLFSQHSDPLRHAPMGPRVRVIMQSDDVFASITPRDFRHKAKVSVG